MTAGAADALRRIDQINARIRQIVGSRANETPATKNGEASFAGVLQSVTEEGCRVPAEMKPLFGEIAKRYNLPQSLLESVARHESGFNARAVSPKGAQGLMQIMPGTQKLLGVGDPFSAHDSLDGGARYLRMMLDRFGGDVTRALAAYNAGPEAVEKFGGIPPYAETRNYVSRILNDFGSGSDNEGE